MNTENTPRKPCRNIPDPPSRTSPPAMDETRNPEDQNKSEPSSGRSACLRYGLMILLFSGIVFLAYSNTFDSPFVFDDLNNIENNPHIRLNRLAFATVKQAALESPAPNRPVANVSFALNYYFHHYTVFGFHLVNVLIHIAAGICLFFFVTLTLKIYPAPSRNRSERWIPFFTALIWLVHPVQTESVTYIVQRMNSLAALFYIFTMLLYTAARIANKTRTKRALFACCLLSGILAIGTKETSATLPLILFLYEWYFFQDMDRGWLKKHLPHLTVALMILLFLAWLYLGNHPVQSLLDSYAHRNFTPGQRILTQFRVVVFYISILLFPHPSRLNLDHDFPVSLSLTDPASTLFSMILIAVLCVLIVRLGRKARLVSFCILWFLGNLVIESSILGLELVFEHRMYLPSMFMSLLTVLLACRYIDRKWLRLEILCVIIIVFSAWTYGRNSVWKTDISLWNDSVLKSPRKARPHMGLGTALMNRGNYRGAMSHFQMAVNINPGDAPAQNSMGFVLAKQQRYQEAVRRFSEALRIKPDYVDACNNWANVLLIQNKIDEAVSLYTRALQLDPQNPEALNNMGVALAAQGKHAEAADLFFRALKINPGDTEALRNLETSLGRRSK